MFSGSRNLRVHPRISNQDRRVSSTLWVSCASATRCYYPLCATVVRARKNCVERRQVCRASQQGKPPYEGKSWGCLRQDAEELPFLAFSHTLQCNIAAFCLKRPAFAQILSKEFSPMKNKWFVRHAR
jgi:hypothetical protein